MKLPSRLILLLLPFLIGIKAQAQVMFYQRDTGIKVFAYGQQQTLAWCGGFNNPQFTMGDLNHDGLQDLIVFEPWNGVRTFINTGTAGSPNYTYAPEYALNFPPVFDYLILADYNCDGIPDLFQQGVTGFAAYKGYYNAANQLCFTFYRDLFYYDSIGGGYANAFNNPGNIPAIVDVDNDGDLDFMSFDMVGGNVILYKDLRTEMGLPCDSIRLEFADYCWSRAFRIINTYELGSCDSSSVYEIHQSNALCLFDYDMDGDYDILDGNFWSDQMVFLTNGRIPYDPSGPDSMVSQDTAWQTGGTRINLPIFPAAYNVDVDQDGKKDLLIAPNAAGENYNCVWYYKNLSTAGAPNWQFQSDSFLVDQSIDVGTAANTMLFDYNKDGLPDLFVGSDGYYQPDGTLRSRISVYQNTSTPGHPSFTLQTKDFLGINAYGFKGAVMATGDIDNDGIADLVIGHSDGTLSYFKNMAANDSVTPNWAMTEQYLTDMAGDTINVGGNAAPFIYDIDKDGKPDLVIGDITGYIQYYRNVSATPGSISLQLINTQLGNARVDPSTYYGNNSTPFFGRIDNSDTDYLLMGSSSGNIYRFTGFQGGDTSATYTMLDSQYSFIDSTFNTYSHMGSPIGIYGNHRSTVSVGNIANDTSYYMIVGDSKGGVELYKRRLLVLPVVSAVNNVKGNGNVLVYPNPAASQLFIEHADIGATVKIYNLLGQEVYSGIITADKDEINTGSLTTGAYFVQLTDNNGNRSTRNVVKR